MPQRRDAEMRLARIARRQHEVFHRNQARRYGISETTIRRRVNAGRWLRLHRHVFASAWASITPEAEVLAAVLAVHDDWPLSRSKLRGAASRDTALALWDLGDTGLVVPHHVTMSGRCQRNLRGVEIHEARRLQYVNIVWRKRIPVTDATWSIAESAGGRTIWELEELLLEAFRRGLTDERRLHDAVAAMPNGPGTSNLRELLRRFDPQEAARLMSILETRFLTRVVRRYDLPAPVVDRHLRDADGNLVARLEFSWPRRDLVVEIDGLRFHATAAQKAYDDARQNRLVLGGHRVLRYGARALDAPERIAREIAAALARTV